jgi:hypothetical protein
MNFKFYPDSRIEETIENGYDFNLGEYVNKGWDYFKQKGLFFVLFFIVLIAINAVIRQIPVVGGIGAWVISTPLGVGAALACNLLSRGRDVEFGAFFQGFTFLGQLLLTSLIKGLITVAALIPFFIFMGITLGSFFIDMFQLLSNNADPDPEQLLNMFQEVFSASTILIALILWLPAIFVSVIYQFAPFIVVFYKDEFWPALERSRKLIQPRFFQFFVFGIVLGLINLLGAICLGIGLLITVPVTSCAVYAAFHDILRMDEIDEESEDDLMDNLVVE